VHSAPSAPLSLPFDFVSIFEALYSKCVYSD
jgi:hypothetical protein